MDNYKDYVDMIKNKNYLELDIIEKLSNDENFNYFEFKKNFIHDSIIIKKYLKSLACLFCNKK